MRILSTPARENKTDGPDQSSKAAEKNKKGGKVQKHQRMNLSPREIMQKVKEHEASNGQAAAARVELSSKTLGSARNPEKEVVPIGEVVTEPYGGMNDPSDPVTVGKLKDLLQKDGFNFNGREKEVLSEILHDKK